MKPIFSYLRNKKFSSVVYLDDFLLIGDSQVDCQQNLNVTISLLKKLGFFVNTQKSQLVPTQETKFLGFMINTKNMQISASQKRKEKIVSVIHNILPKQKIKIKLFSQLIGHLISVCTAVEYGWLYVKLLEREKFLSLGKSGGNYNKNMYISPQIKKELTWWLDNVNQSKTHITQPDYKITIYSDASRSGWGACCDQKEARGFWHQKEWGDHINVLELKAALYGLQSFPTKLHNCHILLKIDNKTAIAIINKMGSIKYPKLNKISRELWQWCQQRHIFVFASYINTLENFVADKNSRDKNVDTEYSLSKQAFAEITSKLGKPSIDLFATYLNKKCNRFVSWHPNPESTAVDAFTLNWRDLRAYIFPPFSLMAKVLNKICSDNARCIVVYPMWKAQPWYPRLESMISSEVVVLKPNTNLLLSPFRNPHPLWKHLTLGAAVLSGSPMEGKMFNRIPWI